jgi:acyl-CoA hydrolase
MKDDTVKMTRMVTCKLLNSHNHLFGGQLMKWMDEVAFIAATRYTRKRMVTTTVEKTKFQLSVPQSTFIEISAKVINNSGVKLHVLAEAHFENIYEGVKRLAAESHFYFACTDQEGHPVRIPPEL